MVVKLLKIAKKTHDKVGVDCMDLGPLKNFKNSHQNLKDTRDFESPLFDHGQF